MSLDQLNDFCLIELFKFISFKDLFKFRILNRRLYFLIKDYLQLIKHVEFNYEDIKDVNILNKIDNQLIKTGNRLNVFKYKELFNFNCFIISNFFHLENLITLKLVNLEFNLKSFRFLIEQSFIGTTLEHLFISKCNFLLDEQMESNCWDLFLERCGTKLKSLILIKNRMNTSSLIKKIASNCLKLNSLSLDLNQFYCLDNDYSIDQLNNDNKSLLKQIPIRNLKLYGTKKEYFNSNILGKLINLNQILSLKLDCVSISNTHLIHLFNQLNNIRCLKFVLNSNNRNVDDYYTELAYSIATRPFIEQLHLLETREVVLVDELFQVLIPILNNKLKVLEIHNLILNDYTFELICNSLTNLKRFYINSYVDASLESYYYSITLSKRIKRFNLINNLKKLINLTNLSLVHTIVTDDEINDLLNQFDGNLTYLLFDNCLELTIKTIEKICYLAFINSNKKYKLLLSNDLYKQIENSTINQIPINLTILKTIKSDKKLKSCNSSNIF